MVELIIFMCLINVHVIEYISLPMVLLNFRSIIISYAYRCSIIIYSEDGKVVEQATQSERLPAKPLQEHL